MKEKKKEKPKKIAYVVAGRSLLTKIGCANAGAKVTPSMIAAGTPESQETIFYRLIREDGVLELPKTLQTELKNAAKENKQISLEDFFGGSSAIETSPETSPETDPETDLDANPDANSKKSKRKRGAQRK